MNPIEQKMLGTNALGVTKQLQFAKPLGEEDSSTNVSHSITNQFTNGTCVGSNVPPLNLVCMGIKSYIILPKMYI